MRLPTTLRAVGTAGVAVAACTCTCLAKSAVLEDSFDRYLARWGSADRMREYNGQMGLWVSKVQSTLTAAVVL